MNPEVLFYHLTTQTSEQALPLLLEKTREREMKAFIQVGSKERATLIDKHLWTYKDDSFLAHSISGEGGENESPVLISTEIENQNNAEFLFLLDQSPFPVNNNFKRIFILFSSNNDDELNAARQLWKELKLREQNISYFQQDDAGKWDKKA